MKRGRAVAIGAVVLLVVAQLVPYGRDKSNPPVVEEPPWDSPETKALAQRACFDCHSNETVWPWYSHVAPASWLVYKDVMGGREEMNLSEWNRTWEEAEEAPDLVMDGKMPLKVYLPLHADARLTDEERSQLAQGLRRTFKTEEWE